MLFSIILFTVALQSSAVFLITWHCWPNIITSAGKDRKEPGDGRNWTRATDDAVISA